MKTKLLHTAFIFLILGSLFSCQESNKPRQQVEIDSAWNQMSRFFTKLPFQNADSTIMLIEQQVKNPLERDFLYKIMLNNQNTVSNTTLFQYFTYIESHLDEKNEDMRGYLLIRKGTKYLEVGKADSAFILAQKGLYLQKKGKDSLMICKAFFDLSNMYLMQDFALSATATCLEGLKYIPQNAKISDIQGAKKMFKHNLLISYRKQRNHKKTLELAKELIQIAEQEKDSMNLTLLHFSLGVAYARTNRKDSALWAGQRATNIFNAYSKRDESENTALGFSFLWRELKVYDKALEYAEKTRQVSDKSNNKTYLGKALLYLANIYLAKGELTEAEKYYQQILADSSFSKTLTLRRDMADSLLVLGLKKEQNIPLLEKFYLSKKLSDSLAKREDKQLLSDMNIRYEISEKESKIKELALEKKAWQIQALIAAFLLLSGFVLTIWAVYRNRQRHLLLEKENLILTIREELQSKEIEQSKEALLRFNERILAKNKLIEEMQSKMNKLLENTTYVQKETIDKNTADLNAMKILTDNDWKNFLTYFENAKPNVIQQLKTQFPELTQGEIRIFLLMNLGFEREQIADILGISPDSARKNQYRLRKKLGLNDEKELEEFVVSY